MLTWLTNIVAFSWDCVLHQIYLNNVFLLCPASQKLLLLSNGLSLTVTTLHRHQLSVLPLHCTLRNIALPCTFRNITLHCTALSATLLCTALHFPQRYSALHCTFCNITLHCPALSATLPCTALHCPQQHIALNALFTALHCTVHYTAFFLKLIHFFTVFYHLT